MSSSMQKLEKREMASVIGGRSLTRSESAGVALIGASIVMVAGCGVPALAIGGGLVVGAAAYKLSRLWR
jgi:hypothetical protein